MNDTQLRDTADAVGGQFADAVYEVLLQVAGGEPADPAPADPAPLPAVLPWTDERKISEAHLSAGWKYSGAVDSYGAALGDKCRYADRNGLTCRWTFTPPADGRYAVWAWMASRKADGTRYVREDPAQYELASGSGIIHATAYVSQNASGWVRVSTLDLDAGPELNVFLTSTDSSAGRCCVADAMKLVEVLP